MFGELLVIFWWLFCDFLLNFWWISGDFLWILSEFVVNIRWKPWRATLRASWKPGWKTPVNFSSEFFWCVYVIGVSVSWAFKNSPKLHQRFHHRFHQGVRWRWRWRGIGRPRSRCQEILAVFTRWREARVETWRWRGVGARRQQPRQLAQRTGGEAGGDQDMASHNAAPWQCLESEFWLLFRDVQRAAPPEPLDCSKPFGRTATAMGSVNQKKCFWQLLLGALIEGMGT